MKPIVSMRVVDWYLPDTEENFYANMFVRALSRKYDVRYSKNPDFLIYGTFGYEHLRYDCVRIFFHWGKSPHRLECRGLWHRL